MLTWQEIIEKYIVKYSNQIKKATKPLRDHFGIGYFTYHKIDNEGKYTVLVNRPDWAEHYVGQKIYLNDPYLRNAQVYKPGLCLIESHGSDAYRNNIMKEGKTVLDMDMCVLLIQKNEQCVEFFGFSGKNETSCLQSLYLNHPQLLESFATHFKKELHPILTQMEDEANSLANLKGKDFHSEELIYPEVPLASRKAYLKDLGMNDEIQKSDKLTIRERQCLKLLIDGKSAKETAIILKLSPRTVESYFENIKNKFSCWSKNEVFTLAKNINDIGLL